ncbi:hypothetical protein ABK040_009806 [Willaertia magna]
MSITLMLLCGLPGVGKSTLSQILKEQLSSTHRTSLFSYDFFEDLKYENQNTFLPEIWRETRTEIELKVKELIISLKKKSHNDGKPNIIILDDNFYYKSMRQTFVQLCQTYQIGHIQIILRTIDINICLERNRNRDRKVEDNVIIEMNSKFEYDNCSSNPNIIFKEFEINYNTKLENVAEEIISLLNSEKVKPLIDLEKERLLLREESIKINKESFIQNLDQSIRKKIKELMEKQIITSNNMKQISNIKKDILKQAKNNNNNLTTLSIEAFINHYLMLFLQEVKILTLSETMI